MITRRGFLGVVAGTGAAYPMQHSGEATVRMRAKAVRTWYPTVTLEFGDEEYRLSFSQKGEQPVIFHSASGPTEADVIVTKVGDEIVSVRSVLVDGKPLELSYAELAKVQCFKA